MKTHPVPSWDPDVSYGKDSEGEGPRPEKCGESCEANCEEVRYNKLFKQLFEVPILIFVNVCYIWINDSKIHYRLDHIHTFEQSYHSG